MNLFIDGLIFGRQRWGGISRMWEALLNRLPRHVENIQLLIPARHKNPSLKRLLASQNENNPPFAIKTDFFHWPVRWFEPVSIRGFILKSLYLSHNVDIFHSTYFSTVSTHRAKKVATVYDMIPELFQRTDGSKWVEKEIAKKRETLLNADKVIAISHHTKNDLIRIYPEVPPEKIEVIHLGLFSDINSGKAPAGISAPPAFEETLHMLDLAEHPGIQPGNYFLYVGNRRGYKNFDILIQWAASQSGGKEAVFLCVGGEDATREKEALARRGLNQFIFTGYADDCLLTALYRNAAAFLCPSRYEGFGLPVLEAMENGCPVVCANTSSLPEVGGDAPFYFDPESVSSLDDALKSLSSGNREAVVNKGIQNVRRFSWDSAAEKLAAVYRSLYE